jgi:hypothetical protein
METRIRNENYSRWLSIEPMGLGTGMVECLTSYLARSAYWHGLTTWSLVARELAPRFSRRAVLGKLKHCELFGHLGAALNGLAGTASEAVELVNVLTARDNLGYLTLLPLSGVVSQRSSVRQNEAWCPACLNEFAAQRAVYIPLLWKLRVVEACPVHSIRLVNVCPHCHKRHFPLRRYAFPGICSRCRKWLGREAEGEKASALDLKVANLCSNLLQELAGSLTPSYGAFVANLRQIRQEAFDGSALAFARAARMDHSTLGDLLAGRARPGLDSVIRLALAAGVDACTLLGKTIPTDSLKGTLPSGSGFPPRHCRRYDWEALAKKLDRAGRDQAELESFTAICRRERVDGGYVAVKLPRHAESLKRHFSAQVCQRKATRERLEREDLVEKVVSCFRHDVWPSHRRLKLLLKSPGSLRNPRVEEERVRLIQCAMQELKSKAADADRIRSRHDSTCSN